VEVRRVSISNFRGVRSGHVLLDSHSLLVGGNAVGKSTICEALDLALGLERLYRRPVINEYDFYKADYRSGEAGSGVLPELRIEVVLTDLSEEARRRFARSSAAMLWRDERFRATCGRRCDRACQRRMVPAGGVCGPV
jgi:putative ATP-dependent endonuclease of OLD family